ncbi:hypothetical protein EDC04DRAFT_2557331 [Pisolithus marmoratus]|nr:hypothetical protein EDC04DRAFT_2557331 [Pisolithus marmoratus]
MGKLNIAHHKSYHPYRRDNIERVRKDEEEAARQEAEKESKMAVADAEARLGVLRERAGLGTTDEKGKGKAVEGGKNTLTSSIGTGMGTGKHINLFEDLEQQELVIAARASKKTTQSETEKGVPLAPSAKDLNPWYADKRANKRTEAENENDQDEKRPECLFQMGFAIMLTMRDMAFKTINDPLTAITQQLAARSSSSNDTRSALPNNRWRNNRFPRKPDPPPPPPQPKQLDPASERLRRESSERERALALIRKKKREMEGSETPSTVHGGMDNGYGDVFNRREVEEAHAQRDRWRRTHW